MKMIFKDVVNEFTLDEIVDYYMEKDGLPESDRAELYDTYGGFLKTLESKDPVETNRVLLGIRYSEYTDDDDTILCFDIGDLEKNKYENNTVKNMSFEEIDNLPGEKAEELEAVRILPRSQGYEYRPWDEVLGYVIDKSNLDEYGALQFIKEVFFKITFFGFDEDYIAEAREAIEATMAQVDEVNEMSEEEKAKHIFTPERAAASFSFQDNRSFQEKQESRFKSARDTIKRKVLEYMVVFNFLKKRRAGEN
ncbi:MAG: DUF6557 family protein [Clostridiales bacterium]|nr:DUF6557 family protein [Clostridiales bacterium]MDU1042596.1 DUF6557 family protein [Clostridiales bacterium]MDU3490227.1 DUF6557 family protein [Clostridiales bacterium]